MTAPGWYVDPDDDTLERYWNGGSWQKERRSRQVGASEWKATPSTSADPQVTPEKPDDGLRAAATFIYLLTILTVIGAVVGGVGLMSHKVAGDCVDFYCSSDTYPYRGAGWAVLAGGLVQAVVLGTVGRLCTVVSMLRAAQGGPRDV